MRIFLEPSASFYRTNIFGTFNIIIIEKLATEQNEFGYCFKENNVEGIIHVEPVYYVCVLSFIILLVVHGFIKTNLLHCAVP